MTLAAAAWFARTLDYLGLALGLPEALLGLLTALAADAPELTSAIVASVRHAPAVGAGVVLGSNVFNLAAMVGGGAVVAGALRVRRPALLLEAAVGAIMLAAVAALLARVLPAAAVVAIAAAVGIPYLLLLTAAGRAVHDVHVERPGAEELAKALEERKQPRAADAVRAAAEWRAAILLVPAVAAIVLGSIGMVDIALRLATRWNVSQTLVGTLILATLTSIPNAATALRLARHGRGTAVVSETMNSNTINLVFGIAVPALVVATATLTGGVIFDLAALAVMTLVAIALLARPAGVGRAGGWLLVALYAAYVAVHVAGGF